MSHNSLKERISVEAIAHHRKRQIHQFGDYCYLTQQLLMSNPQGLKKHKVQSAIGISEKTASQYSLGLPLKKMVSILSILCECIWRCQNHCLSTNTAVSRETLRQLQLNDPTFPKPYKQGTKRQSHVYYDYNDLVKWHEQQKGA